MWTEFDSINTVKLFRVNYMYLFFGLMFFFEQIQTQKSKTN